MMQYFYEKHDKKLIDRSSTYVTMTKNGRKVLFVADWQ